MRVLAVACAYPTPEMPDYGTYVYDQVESLRAAGVDIDVLFVNGRRSKWNYFWAVFRLWRTLYAQRYDLIHAHYVLAGVVARAQWGHKVVLTHHGCELLGHPRWQTWLARVVTPLFDAVIYVAEPLRRALRDTDGWVIPCGIALEDFAPLGRAEARARLGLAPDAPLVLFAADPARPEKRFHLVEQAMARVRERLPDAQLVVVTGRPHDVVSTYMSACDVLVLTSAAEGSPMVIKEAMASNLPIVSVDVGDIAEVIQGTAGCALCSSDPADIADKLVDVLREPKRTDGRVRIGHLRHDLIATRVLEVYQRTLQARRATDLTSELGVG